MENHQGMSLPAGLAHSRNSDCIKVQVETISAGFLCVPTLWQYGLWSFQTGYTKLERCLHKNQPTQRKLLNFENWTNGEPQ